MRVAGSSLAFSVLLFAAPAFAQGGAYYDPGSPYNPQQMNQNPYDRYEYFPLPDQTWQGPVYYGQLQPNYAQQPGQQWQVQPGSMQEMMRHHQAMMQQRMQGGYPPGPSHPGQTGQTGQSTPGPMSFTTPSQIKSSLESSGFKNVAVLPQSYLIRATAPDGSRIVMQVSADSLYGVFVNPTDQGGPSGTGGATSSTGTGGTSSSGTGSTSGSTGATTTR